MRTQLFVRPQSGWRASTECVDGYTVLVSDYPMPGAVVGATAFVSIDGATAVAASVTAVEEDGRRVTLDIACGESFVCSGIGLLVDTSLDPMPVAAELYTSTGYVTVSGPSGMTVYGTGDPFSPISDVNAQDGSSCVYGSDAVGNPIGGVVQAFIDISVVITRIDLSGVGPSLQILIVQAANLQEPVDLCDSPNLISVFLSSYPFETLDVSCLASLQVLDLSFSAIQTIDVSANTWLTYVNFGGCSMPEATVDSILNQVYANAMSLGLIGGQIYLNGGTNAPPSPASATAVAWLTSNSWSVNTN